MASGTCISDLNDEVLVEIFSYLSGNDLVHSARHVCSRWKEAASSPKLWRDLVYKPDRGESESQIVSVLQRKPGLHSLILTQKLVHIPVLHTFIDKCPDLKRLEFHENQLLCPSFLENLVKKCPIIEYLSIPNIVLRGLEEVKIIGKLHKLKILHIAGREILGNPTFLTPLADGCPALQHIDLTKVEHNFYDLAYFLHKKRDQLLTLSVRWKGLESAHTVPTLLRCRVLKTLLLDSYQDSGCFEDDHETWREPCFELLRDLTSITSVTFNSLGCANLNDVTSVFSNNGMGQLEEVRILNYANYKDELAKVIVDNCPHLKLLHLKHCMTLSDETVKVLHMLNELQDISLCESSITDTGVAYLRKCKHLNCLDLECCQNLKVKSMELVSQFRELIVLKLDRCDIKGLCFHSISTHMPDLTKFSINYCTNVNRTGLKQLRFDKPNITVYDKDCSFDVE